MVRQVLGISGGKDSAALAIYLKNKYPDLRVEYYNTDTGCELEETEQLINRLESVLGKISRLKAAQGSPEPTPFHHFLKSSGGYLPSPQARCRLQKIDGKNTQQNQKSVGYTGPYPIQISVYADKIMIWNYGRLPENWTVEDLLNKHSSQPRNPDIPTAFFRSGYVEAWGKGMDNMKDLCVKAKIPVPQFSCKGNDFWTIFRKDIYNKEDLSKLGLNERQIDALLFFKAKREITSSEYAEKYNISDRTARRDLSELTTMELLKNEGDNKLSRYVFP